MPRLPALRSCAFELSQHGISHRELSALAGGLLHSVARRAVTRPGLCPPARRSCAGAVECDSSLWQQLSWVLRRLSSPEWGLLLVLPSLDTETHVALAQLAAARQDELWRRLPAAGRPAAAAGELDAWIESWHQMASAVQLLGTPLSSPSAPGKRMLPQLSASMAVLLRELRAGRPAASGPSEAVGAAPVQTGARALAVVLKSAVAALDTPLVSPSGAAAQRQQQAGGAPSPVELQLVLEAAGLCSAALAASLRLGYPAGHFAGGHSTHAWVGSALADLGGWLLGWLSRGADARPPIDSKAALGAAEAALRLAAQLAAEESKVTGAEHCFAAAVAAADWLLQVPLQAGGASWPAEWVQHVAVSASKLALALAQLPAERLRELVNDNWALRSRFASILKAVSGLLSCHSATSHGGTQRWVCWGWRWVTAAAAAAGRPLRAACRCVRAPRQRTFLPRSRQAMLSLTASSPLRLAPAAARGLSPTLLCWRWWRRRPPPPPSSSNRFPPRKRMRWMCWAGHGTWRTWRARSAPRAPGWAARSSRRPWQAQPG